MAQRGRPKLIKSEEAVMLVNATKFTRVYTNEDGSMDTWYYDLDIRKSGPVSVEYEPSQSIAKVLEDKIPKSQKKYLNPINGKMVSYCRARQLNLV